MENQKNMEKSLKFESNTEGKNSINTENQIDEQNETIILGEKKTQKPPLLRKIIAFFAVIVFLAGFAAVKIMGEANTANEGVGGLFDKVWVFVIAIVGIMLSNEIFNAIAYKKEKKLVNKSDKKLSKRTLFAAAMVLIAVPLTIYIGTYYFGDRKFYVISTLIIIETILPFIFIFENKKVSPRELVVIAVLCALGVAGRTAFFPISSFKPLAAIIIISGISFGAETGFLVGGITVFLSNFFFGQGPWTAWQMFAFGILGFLAGILFKKGFVRTRAALCFFGGFAVFFIYGGIMNPAFVFMFQGQPTMEMIYLAYIQGAPLDIIHAMSTVVFLFFIGKPMLEKLDRIKTKYGIIQK